MFACHTIGVTNVIRSCVKVPLRCKYLPFKMVSTAVAVDVVITVSLCCFFYRERTFIFIVFRPSAAASWNHVFQLNQLRFVNQSSIMGVSFAICRIYVVCMHVSWLPLLQTVDCVSVNSVIVVMRFSGVIVRVRYHTCIFLLKLIVFYYGYWQHITS